MTSSIEALVFTYGVLGGLGVGIVYGAPMAIAAKWFPEKKGFFVGLTLAGFGLSPFITAPVSELLIEQYDLFYTFKILGFVFLGILLLLTIPLRFPNKGEVKANAASEKEGSSSDLNLSRILRSGRFYILWISFIIGAFSGLMAIGISSPVAQEIIGLDATVGSLAVALFAIFNGLGRPVFGLITDKLQFKKTALISFSLIMAASGLMLFSGEGTVIIYLVSFSLFWFLFGGWLAIAPTAVSHMFGAKNYARNYGILFTAYGVGAFLGNLVAGAIKDTFGSYQFVFYSTLIAGFAGILLVTFSEKSKKVLEPIPQENES
jgi:MFS family permease